MSLVGEKGKLREKRKYVMGVKWEKNGIRGITGEERKREDNSEEEN